MSALIVVLVLMSSATGWTRPQAALAYDLNGRPPMAMAALTSQNTGFEPRDKFATWCNQEGITLYDATPEVGTWVAEMTDEGVKRRQAGFQPGAYNQAAWDGTWRVKHAPHIRTLSSVFFSKFDIAYHIKGKNIVSNVRFTTPIVSGWLNASGTVDSLNEYDSEVLFDTFWVDISKLEPSEHPSTDVLSSVINSVGQKGFVPSLSRFPVWWLDADYCIFEFPPLGVNITAQRVA